MQRQQEGRGGGAPPVLTEPSAGADKKTSVALAALASLKGLGAKVTGSTPDRGSSGNSSVASRRPSRVSQAASRRGSLVPPTAGQSVEGADSAEPAPTAAAPPPSGIHPGLSRIKSFSRKKSVVFRVGGRTVSFDELAAAMDAVDGRLGGVLVELRTANAAGLGAVRGLHHSKSGKLPKVQPGASGGSGSAARPGTAEAAAEAVAEVDGVVEVETESGAAPAKAVETPDSLQQLLLSTEGERASRTLQRVTFEARVLHRSGSKTARGRLEGNEAAAAAVEAADGALVPHFPYLVNPRWGSSAGAVDRLGWLRNLVQFRDFRQRQQQAQQQQPLQPASASAGDSSEPPVMLDTISWLESGAGLRPQTAAAAGAGGAGGGSSTSAALPPRTATRSREEVAMLQAWLQDMMGLVIAQTAQQAPSSTAGKAAGDSEAGGGGSAADPRAAGERGDSSSSSSGSGGAADLADAALWLYGMAFEELQRQIATECGERGLLLGAMWRHAFHLVELRVSLLYEGVIGAIRDELVAVRKQAAAAMAAAGAAEQRVRDSMYYSRDRFTKMEEEVKRMAQLLASADDETSRHAEQAAMLRRALDSQSSLRATAEGRLADEQRRRMEVEAEQEELVATSQEQASAVSAQAAELAQLRAELQRCRAEGRALAEDRARLEVEARSAQRSFQTAEIMGLGLREQLAAREAELAELTSRHSALQAEQAAAAAQLLDSQASLAGLQVRHESLQATSGERVQQLEAALGEERGALADTRGQLAEVQAERQALERGLQETASREAALAAQLRQLAGAHEQQSAKLRQEADARRNGDDELQAVRAGLQVTQQRLEGWGVVFASTSAHRTAAEAWRATGPISMARQVVAAANQHLAELAAQRAALRHDLAAAKERWQAEEGVRIRLQEQVLEVRARESKLRREREGLEGVVARLESQHASMGAELSQMRRMLAEAEARCQASHRQAMEAAGDAKRLAPLEPRVAKLEESLRAAHAELEQAQREMTAHQSSIRKLLDEKSTALEQLAARGQALDAAQLQVRELASASRDRVELAGDKAKLEEELHSLRQRCSATERLQGESMHQLAVARRLLADAHSADERARLSATEQQLQGAKSAVAAHRRESLLLKDRLTATQGQLQFMERQLEVAVHSPLAAAVAAAAAPGVAPTSAALVHQLRRLLETKEERIRQLERAHGLLTATATQLKQLQGELGRRDEEVQGLRAEVQATRARLHTLQEAQARVASKDLVVAAATDPGLPRDIAQALALDHTRKHLVSDLAWTKAKLVVVCHMASGLRAKLQQAQDARQQAELESVCVEAYWLEQALMDQRAFAAAFDATFAQVKRMLASTQLALAEVRRQLAAPAAADLPRIAEQVQRLAAALASWLGRFQGRKDQSCQADPLAELAAWQLNVLAALPAARPASPPPLPHVSSIIVQVYAHRVRQLPLQGPQEPSALLDNAFEAMAQFFCERRGFSRQAALSPTGPVAALLAGARAHLQQPKQLLLGRLAGLVAGGGSGSSRSLQHPAAWQFFVRLLCCLRALLGAGWEALVKEWAESEEGVPLPLQCVVDVLANLYNTDAPALLDTMRRGLVPLVRQGRRGPAVDLDALLLVLMEEYSDGSCPISPLALPRRLIDGAVGTAGMVGTGPQKGLAGTVSGVALAVGGSEAYAAAGGGATPAEGKQQQQRSPMRKRIINLTAVADSLPLPAAWAGPRSATASPEPATSQQVLGGGGGSTRSPPAAQLPGLPAAATKSLHVLMSMHSLMSSNPALPVGLRSQLRASSPSVTPTADKKA